MQHWQCYDTDFLSVKFGIYIFDTTPCKNIRFEVVIISPFLCIYVFARPLQKYLPGRSHTTHVKKCIYVVVFVFLYFCISVFLYLYFCRAEHSRNTSQGPHTRHTLLPVNNNYCKHFRPSLKYFSHFFPFFFKYRLPKTYFVITFLTTTEWT